MGQNEPKDFLVCLSQVDMSDVRKATKKSSRIGFFYIFIDNFILFKKNLSKIKILKLFVQRI